MSILEIILYSALGIGVTTYVVITIIKWTKRKKTKKDEDEDEE